MIHQSMARGSGGTARLAREQSIYGETKMGKKEIQNSNQAQTAAFRSLLCGSCVIFVL
jgi:hypothetical protein